MSHCTGAKQVKQDLDEVSNIQSLDNTMETIAQPCWSGAHAHGFR